MKEVTRKEKMVMSRNFKARGVKWSLLKWRWIRRFTSMLRALPFFRLEGSKVHSIFKSPTPKVKAQAFKMFNPFLHLKHVFLKSISKWVLKKWVGEGSFSGFELVFDLGPKDSSFYSDPKDLDLCFQSC